MSKLKSNHLCHVSPNLQRSSRKRDSGQVGVSDILKAKQRCLESRTRTTRGENSEDDIVSNTLREHSVNMVLDLGLEENAMEFVELDFPSSRIVESNNSNSFRREIRIDLLEIVDLMEEIDGISSSINGDFTARCTLEIFLAGYESEAKRKGLKCGEDIWRSQQMCAIRTICDDFGHSTSNLILPTPFIIQAENLLEKKSSTAIKLGLSDQYIVKVWLEAPSTECRWPPLELESTLDPHGRIMTSLREGTLSSTALRLIGKGVLFPEEGACDKLEMSLKLGDFRVRTKYALKLDVKYSIPPKSGIPLNLPQPYVKEPLNKPESMTRSHASAVGLTSIVPPDLDNADVSVGKHEIPDIYRQRRAHSPLAVPCTKKRLCGDVVKNVLTAGEELDPVDDEAETDWQITRNQEMIKDLPDITNTMKEYVMRWNQYIRPLKLSCNLYLPQVLLGFVKGNITWFGEDSRRIREFSLHATSLRLRGSISIECFANCTDILRNHIKSHKKLVNLKSTDVQTTDHPVDDGFHSKHSTDEIRVDDEAVNEKCELENLNIRHIDEDNSNTEAADEETAWEEALDLKPPCVESVGEGVADENEIPQNTSSEDGQCGKEILGSGTNAKDRYAEVDETFEDASEELDAHALEDFFDAEDEIVVFDQPFYLHSYWQSIIKRWPRLKLHGPYSFGVASLLVAIAIFQGFPDDNIDRLIALYIHYCPNENIRDLINMYFHAIDVVPEVEGVCMTELKLHRIMWEASRETCEYWLTDVYRLEGGTRKTVREAIETATNEKAWDELWEYVSNRCG